MFYDQSIFIFIELSPCFIKAFVITVIFKMLHTYLLKRTIKTLHNNYILSFKQPNVLHKLIYIFVEFSPCFMKAFVSSREGFHHKIF